MESAALAGEPESKCARVAHPESGLRVPVWHGWFDPAAAGVFLAEIGAPCQETFANDQDTRDIDFQYHFELGSRHDLVTGVQARYATMDSQGIYDTHFSSPHLTSFRVTGFLQDEFQLTEHVSLIAGSKLERNSFTGFEYEPSGQLVWASRSI